MPEKENIRDHIDSFRKQFHIPILIFLCDIMALRHLL